MPIVTLIIWLVIIGFLLWLATTFIPMNDKIKQILVGAVVVAVVLWLLYIFLPSGGPWIGRHH